MGLGTAFRAFFAALFDKSAATRIRQALSAPSTNDAPKALPDVAPPPTPMTPAPTGPVELDPRSALIVLAEMQKEGRLLDFLHENLDDLADADIGVAVREIHRGCKAALTKYFAVAPVREESEGDSIEVPRNFDPTELRLIGSAGDPPFSATLQHRGWRVTSVKLPTVTGDGSAQRILAPAEAERGA